MGVYYAISRACTNKSLSARTRRWLSISAMSFFTISTMWFGFIFFEDKTSRTAAYILRRTLFLETAVLNVFFGAVGENLKLFAPMYFRVKRGEYNSRPVLTTRSNSFTERRLAFDSMIVPYTVRRRLPFARRRLTTFLPAVVFALFRKPCDRARFLFFGLYVNDIVFGLITIDHDAEKHKFLIKSLS